MSGGLAMKHGALWVVVAATVSVIGPAGPVVAQTPPGPAPGTPLLRQGAAAPRLGAPTWIKGEPVDLNDRARVYVVEFWATWCGPCVQQFPGLTEMQSRFKDQGLVIVGMNSGDKDEAAARAFVERRGEDMGYRVAFDRGRDAWRALAEAAGFRAIPLAVVIDRQGRVAFLDHPQHGLDVVVERVLAGTWDPVRDRVPVPKRTALSREARALVARGNVQGALGLLDREAAGDGSLAAFAGEAKFKILYFDANDCERAYTLAASLVTGAARDDADVLANIAEVMINEGQPSRRDPALATRLAERAVEVTHSQDGPIMDVLARCHAARHEWARAVEIQERAVAITPEGQARANMAETLRLMRERLAGAK